MIFDQKVKFILTIFFLEKGGNFEKDFCTQNAPKHVKNKSKLLLQLIHKNENPSDLRLKIKVSKLVGKFHLLCRLCTSLCMYG